MPVTCLRVKDSDMPPAFLEKERQAQPYRPLRLAFYAAVAALSLIASAISAAAFFNVDPAVELRDSLDLPNPIVSAAVCGIGVGLINQDVKDRAKERRKMLREMQRSERRAMKETSKAQKSRLPPALASRAQEGGRGFADTTADRGADDTEAVGAAAAKNEDASRVSSDQQPGPLSGLQKLVDEANEQGRVQAYMLNDALEKRGLVKPLEREAGGEGGGKDPRKDQRE
ncbi:unnamed protein product [Vitrella brassicaformis CCMP3155]|uniref:Uncharacterized protein n=1 Tax=Vitrella brassicaformis (strain CCMP3155) TaxID=1169540 RepID=A0A0G4GY02_VITBC|nr:unnamed protein product [Vitrella brassicaformis CCMP3155]|eukprot:CEM35892.1 unnamed protein product [Vitrella brassicaformis CCMP3155]